MARQLQSSRPRSVRSRRLRPSPGFLPTDQFERLRDFLLNSEWDGREHREGDTVTRRVPIDAALLDRSPELAGLLAMPRWRALMRYVASTGGEPSIISSRSSPGSTAAESAGRAPFGRLPPHSRHGCS